MSNLNPNWMYTVKINHLFTNHTTPEKIVELVNTLIPQLRRIKESFLKSTAFCKEDLDKIGDELENSINNFYFTRALASGEIPEQEWAEYSFEGEFEERFNEYLEQLYDLGDMKPTDKNGMRRKLIFIN